MKKIISTIRANKVRFICVALAFTGATLFYAGENMVGFCLCSLASAIAAEKI